MGSANNSSLRITAYLISILSYLFIVGRCPTLQNYEMVATQARKIVCSTT